MIKFLIVLIITTFFLNTNLYSNFCRPISFYEKPSINSDFQLITITVSIENNEHSFDNRKKIKSVIAFSVSTSPQSYFKILTINKE